MKDPTGIIIGEKIQISGKTLAKCRVKGYNYPYPQMIAESHQQHEKLYQIRIFYKIFQNKELFKEFLGNETIYL